MTNGWLLYDAMTEKETNLYTVFSLLCKVKKHLSILTSLENKLPSLIWVCQKSHYNLPFKKKKVHIIEVFFRGEGVNSDRNMWLWP